MFPSPTSFGENMKNTLLSQFRTVVGWEEVGFLVVGGVFYFLCFMGQTVLSLLNLVKSY